MTSTHDEIQGWLRSLMQLYVEHHDLGTVKGPESMVRLPRVRQRRMPDLLFIAKSRASFIKPTQVEGAPDLIVEIVSPDSFSRNWRDKYFDYQRAGVREYWIIDPASQRLEAYARGTGGKYRPIEEAEERMTSSVVPGFFLRPEWVLGRLPPRIAQALRELGTRL